MKWFVWCLVLLLFPLAYAIEPGVPYSILNIDHCYGDLTIKVVAQQNMTDGEVGFLNCIQNESMIWYCDCEGLKNVTFLPLANTENIFTFKLQYYIEDITGKDSIEIYQATRTESINNIVVKKEPIKEEFTMPVMDNVWSIAGIIGGVSLVIVLIIVVIIKMLFSSKKDEIQGVIKKPLNKCFNPIKALQEENQELDNDIKELEKYKKFVEKNKK